MKDVSKIDYQSISSNTDCLSLSIQSDSGLFSCCCCIAGVIYFHRRIFLAVRSKSL